MMRLGQGRVTQAGIRKVMRQGECIDCAIDVAIDHVHVLWEVRCKVVDRGVRKLLGCLVLARHCRLNSPILLQIRCGDVFSEASECTISQTSIGPSIFTLQMC